jgi:hypothetical protein
MTEDQQDAFAEDSVKEAQIEAAKNILMEQGYRIIPPVVVNAEINNQKKLRHYFYMRLDTKYPDRRSERTPNTLMDVKMISALVKARMDTGLGEQAAIQECVAIINAIFDYEKEFKFKYPIKDTRILGQNKLGWVTSKALALIDDKRKEAEHKKIRENAERAELSNEVDREEVGDRLDALLKRMEANNNG